MSLVSDQEPTVLINHADRRLTYRWIVRRTEDSSGPGTLVVQLKVHHDRAGKRYYAELRNATLTDRNVSVETFGWDDPVWSRHQFVARYSTNGLREFAEHTLAELRRADASGEDLHVDLASEQPPSTTPTTPPPGATS